MNTPMQISAQYLLNNLAVIIALADNIECECLNGKGVWIDIDNDAQLMTSIFYTQSPIRIKK